MNIAEILFDVRGASNARLRVETGNRHPGANTTRERGFPRLESPNLPSGARRFASPPDGAAAPSAEEYERLLQISLRLNSTPHLDQLLKLILRSACDLLNAEDASIMLLECDGRTLRFGAIESPFRDALASVTLEIGEGVAGWVAQNGEPLIIDDAYNDPRFSIKGDTASGHRTLNMLCVPLHTPRRTIGTLEVINKPSVFTPHDIPLCMSLANIAAIAIDNIQLRQAAETSLTKLEEVQRSRVEFFNILSHELRTPLAVIQMGLSVLKQRTDDGELTGETLKSMTFNANRLKRLIYDMFILNDLESLQSQLLLRPTRLRDVISAADPWLSGDHDGPRQLLTIDVADDCTNLRLYVDREKTVHCLTHLLDNAFKFSPQGGRPVRLEVRREPSRPMLRFSTIDHGVGIAPDNQERIFDLFYQVDSSMTREFGGTGVGLYVCKQLIGALGGQLWCRSQPGEGSTFSFTVPIHEG